MATKSNTKKAISMEEALWKSADKLRGSVEPAEYKHVVLSLFFLKFASDKFENQRNMVISKYGEKFADNIAFYTKDNVFYLPSESRWNYIMENAKQDDIALKIDTALFTIEKTNPALKGALPDNYYSRLHIDTSKLASLLDEIDKINTDDSENDIIGRVYEYFLGKFALAEGKGKGEFYTPKCIVNLIAELIEPYDGILYDPCCGSGGMFVQSIKFVEAHSGNKKKVSIYGQEYTNTTFKLAKMNLAIRGISANLGEMAANTFTNDQHKDLKADYIMANPPFNQKEWRAENELIDDPRWNGYEVPPTSNANYGWIFDMSTLPLKGCIPVGGEFKPYNGGMRFINGDTILARITPCLENGKAAYINFLEENEVAFGSTEYIVLTPKENVPSSFFYFLARNSAFIAYAVAHMNGSSGRQRVSGSDIANYPIKEPSKKELKMFDNYASKVLHSMKISALEIEKLKELQESITATISSH